MEFSNFLINFAVAINMLNKVCSYALWGHVQNTTKSKTEAEHYPLETPSYIDIIKLRMYEWGLTQKKVAEMLNISISKMSEIINGKTEPSLSLGKVMCQNLTLNLKSC